MIRLETSATPIEYPLLDQIEVFNGRHIVVINHDPSRKGQYPTGKIYTAVTLTLLELAKGYSESLESNINNHVIGFCILAGYHVQALYAHRSIYDQLIDRESGEKGYLIEHYDHILGLINHEFDINCLEDSDYVALAAQATDPFQGSCLLLHPISTFFLQDKPMEGIFPFIMGSSKPIAGGKLSQLDSALDFILIAKFDSKTLKKVIGDKKVAFFKFEKGECTSITIHESFVSYAKSYTYFSVAVEDQHGLLKYQPKIESLNTRQYNESIKEASDQAGGKQTNRCSIS